MKTAWILSDCEPLPCDDNPRLMRAGQLAEYLSSNGWNVVWWAPSFNHGTKKDRFETTKSISVNPHERLVALHSPVIYTKNTSPKRIIFYRYLVKELKKSISEKGRPDVILCSWPTQGFAKVALRYGKKHGVPVILDVRDLWPDIFIRAFPERLKGIGSFALKPLIHESEKLFREADSIIGVTPSSLKWGLKKAHRKKSDFDRVIYIGYNDQPCEQINEKAIEEWHRLDVSKDTWNITYFGTFSDNTLDMVTCINAFKKFAVMHEEARLVLCGAGDAENKFKEVAGSNKQIVFPGWCSNEQIQSLLSISDIGLYPFKNLEDFKDAFGNKIIGYMAAKLPVMTSLEGFSKKYMERYEFGKSYNEGDVLSCKSVLEEFYVDRDKKQYAGQNARDRFEIDFNMPVVNKQFVELFNSLLAR